MATANGHARFAPAQALSRFVRASFDRRRSATSSRYTTLTLVRLLLLVSGFEVTRQTTHHRTSVTEEMSRLAEKRSAGQQQKMTFGEGVVDANRLYAELAAENKILKEMLFQWWKNHQKKQL